MNEKARLIFFAALLLFTLVAIVVYPWIQPKKNSFILNVTVVYLLNKTPMSHVVVQAVTLDGRIIVEQPTNANGQVVLKLEEGQYVLHAAAGYTGQVSLNLQSDQAVQLEVLPILE